MLLKIVALLVLVGLHSESSPLFVYQANAFDILPIDKAFTIRSIFLRDPKITFQDVADKLTWVESYSLERQIVKIDYYTTGITEKIDKTLFKDKFGPMVFDKTERKCDARIELFNQILLDAMPLNNDTLDSWMIGPSVRALLSFLQETEGKTLIYEKVDGLQASTSFNGRNVEYSLSYRVMDRDDQYRNQIPISMRLDVKLGDKTLMFILFFGGLQVMNENDSEWDRFAINPNEGLKMSSTDSCYQPRLKRVFNQDIYNANKFSFRYISTAVDTISETRKGQVDYHGRLGMMQTKTREQTSSKSEQKLFNFKKNRRYYTFKAADESTKPIYSSGSTVIMQEICSSGQARREACYPNEQSLAQILIGSDDMVELGLVRIGGIRARGYSMKSRGHVPYWLKQPSAPVDSGPANDRLPFGETLHDCTIYVSESPQKKPSTDPQLDTVLLAMTLRTDTGSYVVQFYNFVWSANVEGLDMFSLANLMPGPYNVTMGNSSYVSTFEYKIDLNMHLDAPVSFKDTDFVDSRVERDIVLAGALQNWLGWPVHFMSNFESRLLPPRTSGKIVYRPLVVSLILAHPIRQLKVDLTYIGSAEKFDDTKHGGNQKIYPVRSLEECLVLATQRGIGKSFFVGFSWLLSECYSCDPEVGVGPNVDDATKAGYTMSTDGTIQVYQAIKHLKVDAGANEIDEQLDTDVRYKLINKRTRFTGLLRNSSEVSSVKIINVDVQELEDNQDGDENIDRPIDFFGGLGLVEESGLSWKIKPEHVNTSGFSWRSHDDSTYNANLSMTLELCQSIALSFDHIESYSLCKRPGDIRCLVSRLSFRDPSLGQTLLKVERNLTIKPGNFEIEMQSPDDTAKLIKTKLEKYGNCELHNKRYIEAFRLESSGSRHVPKGELVYQMKKTSDMTVIDGLEKCSNLCFKHNLNFMRKDAKEIGKAVAELGNNSTDMQWAVYRDRSGHICKQIGYFAHDTSGYCIIEGPNLDDVGMEPVMIESDLETLVKTYSLDAEIFFDRTVRKHLRESKMPEEVKVAYEKLVGKSKDSTVGVNQDELELLKKFIKDGGNFQKFKQCRTISECALACFSQSEQLWPGCKSFEVLEIFGRSRINFCYLNTVTMQEVLQNPGPNVPRIMDTDSYKHFEPRAGFLLDDLNAFKEATMSANATTTNSNDVTFLGYLIVFAIVCIQMIIGLFLGVKLTNYVMTSQSSNPFSRFVPDDTANLVPTLP